MKFDFPSSRQRGAHRARAAFTLVELLVVIAIIGILVALLLPAIQAAREAARRAQCQSNIKNAALAVLNYESTKKVLPDGMTFDPTIGGNAGANASVIAHFGPSWIIHVLPYLEEQPLYDAFDLKKDINDPTQAAPNNRNYLARGATIAVLLCPSDSNNKTLFQGMGGNWGRNNYAASAGRAFIYGLVGPTGANTSGQMSGADPPNNKGWTEGCQRGVMGPNVGAKLAQITDGTTKTIMIGEIRAGLTDQDPRGVWALGHAGPSLLAKYGAGGDDAGPNFCGNTADDILTPANPPYCDGDPSKRNPETGNECMTCSQGGFDQQTTRSKHPGGVHVAMADGSAQFISDDIETNPGINSSCCTVWDYMIASADEGKPGLLNGANPRGAYCQ